MDVISSLNTKFFHIWSPVTGYGKSHNRTHQGRDGIQPKFPEIAVQNSVNRFGPTGKVSKKLVQVLRWTTFPGRTGRNFDSMRFFHSIFFYVARAMADVDLLADVRPHRV